MNVPRLRFKDFNDEWNSVKLGDFTKVLMCKRIFVNQTSKNYEIPFYKIGTIGGEADTFISKELFNEYKSRYNYPKKGELLITCSGTVGKCTIFDGHDSYYQDSNIVWLDNNENIVNNNFLYYILNNVNWVNLNSTTITRIYGDNLRDLNIKYPAMNEQKKISKFLSLLDKKIGLQSKKINVFKLYKKSLYKIYFSNKLDKYIEIPLKNICEITTGKLDANAMVENGKYRFYTCAKDYYYIDKYAFDTEALLISGNGAYVGYIHYYKGKFNAYQRTYVLTNFKYNIRYIKCYLDCFLSKRINSEKKEGNTPYIVMGTLSNMNIKIPSEEQQKRISNNLDLLTDKINLEEIKLEKLESLKKGLMQKMFV